LFSVPVTNVVNSSTTCSPTSPIYGFSNGKYYQTTYTTGGNGYWVKINSDCLTTVFGRSISINDFPSLNQGWNLIGAPSTTTSFTDIIGNCHVVSGPWWYNPATNSYVQSSNLEPGKGYFVKVSANCKLGPALPPPPPSETIVLTVGGRLDTFLVQKINIDSVDGLFFARWPIVTSEGVPRTLHIGDDIGYACEGISEILTSIDYKSQTVTFTRTVSSTPPYPCPICLSGNTLIDTPQGQVNIKELRSGMSVFTSDKLGNKQPAIILKVGKTEVPSTHMMAHVILDDGRELFASPAHPTADGRTIGDLKSGDVLDHSLVKIVELVPYDQKYTYDILPSGETGFYWANGILVGSTLK